MRKWLVVVCPLLLGACDYDFYSDSPAIPAAELAIPEDMEGQYWHIESGRDFSASVMQWALDRESRSFLLEDQQRIGYLDIGSDPDNAKSRLRLIDLPEFGAYLAIGELNNGRSTYRLLHRRDSSILELDSVQVGVEFSGQSIPYLQKVAKRHGFELERVGETSIDIIGPVDGLGIPNLFRDPAFLAALHITPESYYFRLDGASAPSSRAIDLQDNYVEQKPIRLAQTPEFSQGDLGHPEGLAGKYAEFAKLRLSKDGFYRFEGRGDFAYRIALLGRSPVDDAYLAVWILDEDNPDPERDDHFWSPKLGVIFRNDVHEGCWVYGDIVRRQEPSLEALKTARLKLMQEAADKQELEFDGTVISGQVNARRLVELVSDGQFTIGLNLSSGHEDHGEFCPLESSTTD